MYAKEQFDYIMAVYGEGEAVKVTGTSKGILSDGSKDNFYRVKHYGRDVYIPSSMLTQKKPEWIYSVKSSFLKLHLEEGAKLYLQPAYKSRRIPSPSAIVLYTLGETNYWYKVFCEGKVCFIRKTDLAILSVSETKFPELKFQGLKSKEMKNVRSRVFYGLSMLPQTARDALAEKNLVITVCRELPRTEFEDAGASGYANSSGTVYLKELDEAKTPYIVESSLIHELGHLLNYEYEKNVLPSCFAEKKELGLREYYASDREYLAETFDYYIKVPEYLKEHAPDTYSMYEERFGRK